MALKYKITDQTEMYFVTFTVVGWVDVFIRESYREIFVSSIKYCQENKGLQVYAWVLMTSHAHLIIGTAGIYRLEDIIRDLKSFTSRKLRLEMEKCSYESRKDWMMHLFYKAGTYNTNNKDYQFWIQDNHPIQLSSGEMLMQRLNYLHNNPVEAGFVYQPEYWKWSSACDYYTGQQGLIDVILVV